jgi:hypothetical protein
VPRMSDRTRTPVGVTCALVALAASLLIATAAAQAATAIHFQRESLPALEAQLAKHEVHALSFHPVPAPGHVHVSLNDGRHMTVVYAAPDQAQLIARARALGVPVDVAVAKAKAASKTTHHKLRYIAAGLVIVVIVVVTVVLLVDRRRRVNEADPGAPAPSSPDSG